MPLVETESLVLRSYNLAEADRIVLFLTHEHGIVRGVAKGAKRLKSKFGSGLEPFSIVRLTYFHKDSVELVSIQQVELLRSYFSLCSEPAFLHKFAYLTDLLTSITPPHSPSEDLYRMVKACLDASAQMPGRLEIIGFYFQLWLLRLEGYLPDWSKCEKCKRVLEPVESANLQINFQLACCDCKKSKGGTIISGAMRQIFAEALKLSPVSFAESTSSETEEIASISEIFRRIFSEAVGRDVAKSRSFVQGI